MTLEEGLMYVINAKKYIDVYGQRAFEAALEEFKVEDFSTFEYVPRDSALDNYYAQKGYPVLCDKTSWEFTEYKGEWERKVRKLAREYRVPYRYQPYEGELHKKILFDNYPYLRAFNCSIYKLDGADEIYVKCENGTTLYVPVEAIAKRDFQIVYNRTDSYFRWYYAGPDRQGYLDKALSALTSDTAAKLKSCMERKDEKRNLSEEVKRRLMNTFCGVEL